MLPKKLILLSLIIGLIFKGCVPMGLHGKMMKRIIPGSSEKVQSVNLVLAIDEMIEEAVQDLSFDNLDVSSIAICRIKSNTAGLNVEMFKRKLITQLVDLDRIKVLIRERIGGSTGGSSSFTSG